MQQPPDPPETKDGPELIWRFGQVRYDAGSRTVTVNGEAITLERKPLEVLDYLLRHAGEVVTKDEIAEVVWTRRVIDDAVITKAVGKLRRELGTTGQEAIKTVHGLGYQLVADVEVNSLGAARVNTVIGVKPGDQPPGREHWKLVRVLGSGGYGEAWLCEHRHTGEERVLKFARDRAGLSALKREVTLYRLLRETLGEHAGIQSLLDWNLTSPPFYIETGYRPAGSLEQWATTDDQLSNMSRTARLELVAKVAEALSAAHGVGVLHKDLKPSNILIDQDEAGALPKLTDFGVGEILDAARLEELRITQLGFTREQGADHLPVGSLMYLAPEIIAGQPSTIRADIFALGVLLFQVVLGDLQRPLAAGWQRLVDDPLLIDDIGTCVDGDPARRIADAGELARRLRSLEARRAQHAAALQARDDAEALEQQLRAQRQRRPWFIALTAAISLGLVSTLWFYYDARRAAEAAVEQRETAEAINQFVLKDLFEKANPELTGQRQIALDELLRGATAGIGNRFGTRPRLEAAIRSGIARLFHGVGDYEAAVQQAHLAQQALLAPDPDIMAQAQLIQARALIGLSRYDEARTVLRELIARLSAQALQKENEFRARLMLVELQLAEGRWPALEVMDTLLTEVEAQVGKIHELSAEAMKLRCMTLSALERVDEARSARVLALERYTLLHGEGNPAVLRHRIDLDETIYLDGSPEVSETLRQSFELAQTALGTDHALSLRAANSYGAALYYENRYAKAEAVLRQALKRQHARFGDQHDRSFSLANNLANTLVGQGRLDEARAIYEQLLAQQAEALGVASLGYLSTRYNRIVTLVQLGRHAEALADNVLMQADLEQAGLEYRAVYWSLIYYQAESEYALGNRTQAIARLDALTERLAQAGDESPSRDRLHRKIEELRGRWQSAPATSTVRAYN